MAGAGTFVLDDPALATLFAQGGMVWLHTEGLVIRITTLAKLYAPVRTGRLRQSITGITIRTGPLGVAGLVGANVDYAVYVHEGTRPHTIRPKDGREFVTFRTSSGRQVFAKEIHHPGTKPHPFLRRALMEVVASQL